MIDLLSVNTIAFTIIGYPMSWIELAATLTSLWSVWLVSRRHILTWPVGIVSVLLFLYLFYQIHLYSDTVEQVYYLVTGVYGWWHWARTESKGGGAEIKVGYSSRRSIVIWVVVTIVASAGSGYLMSRIHLLLPALFPQPAVYPYLDAGTTIMSFVAQWLMTRKHTESWIYWIIVDVIAVGLYFIIDVKFVSLLYAVLLVMAINGFLSWHKSARAPEIEPVAQS
jgi:nicotinamide mononucleotide transporter